VHSEQSWVIIASKGSADPLLVTVRPAIGAAAHQPSLAGRQLHGARARSRPMRAAALLVLLILPAAGLTVRQQGEGERVDITAVTMPAQVLVGRTFYADVTVHNAQPTPQALLLFTVLYDGPLPGSVPCDGARANQRISRFEKSVQLQPAETATVRGEASFWGHVVNASLAGEGDYEACVWARMARCPEGTIEACLLDHEPRPLRVRAVNAPPRVTLRAEPDGGSVGTEFQFTASATDADGDPVAFTWDFGDGVLGEGARVAHRYARPGTYGVTLHATDGVETTQERLTLSVRGAAQSANAPGVGGWVALAVIAAAARAWRARH
jgi:PKD domain-containing protein